jgi:hypothetical protein
MPVTLPARGPGLAVARALLFGTDSPHPSLTARRHGCLGLP